jgi:hypothetical protein
MSRQDVEPQLGVSGPAGIENDHRPVGAEAAVTFPPNPAATIAVRMASSSAAYLC